ncbi:MAG: hypothetical protein ABS889_03810 [Desemzia incerta]
MLTVSNELKNAFMKAERTIYVRIKIGNQTFDNDNVVSIEYDSGSLSGEIFAIGSTYSNSIKITFSDLVEGLKELDEVTYEIGIKLPSGTIEYVSMGIFIINDAIDMDRNNNKTTIECMDKMVMMGGTYVSSLTYPAAIREVALEIANKAGVVVDSTSFARLSADKIAKPEGYTYREAIGLIAQFEAGFATFNRIGKLEIRTLVDPNFSIPPDNYFSKGLVKNEVFFRLGGISCTTDDGDTIIQSGNSAGNQVVLENRVMTKVLLDKIYQKIQTINYYPFSLNWQGNPVIEAGDWVEVEDLQGNKFKTPNLSYSLSFNGGLSAKSSAETVTQSDVTYQYKSPLQQKIEWIHARIDAAGGNVVFEGIDEPTNPKEGDLWFKVIGPDKEILIYRKREDGTLFWDPQISTADIDKVAKEVNKIIEQADLDRAKAEQDIDQALTDAKQYTEVKAQEFNNQLTVVNQNIAEVANAANTAVTKADQAISDAGFAKADATIAKQNALTAVGTANTAKTNAETALGKANTAITNSTTALSTAQTSLTNSGTALKNAQNALNAYNNLDINGRNYIKDPMKSFASYNTTPTLSTNGTVTLTKLGTVQYITIQVVGWTPENAEYSISGIMKRNGVPVKRAEWVNGRFQTQSSVGTLTVNDETGYFEGTQTWTGTSIWIFHAQFSSFAAGDIITIENMMMVKGNKPMDWMPSPESVQVQITNINGELATRVSQTVFDTLKGTVTNQGTLITQSQTAIGLKADKTLVDTINQTVNKHTTDIKVTADGLALKSDKSVVDALNGTVANHTTQIDATAEGLVLKADKSLVDTVKGTVDSHTTQIKATSDGLALKAEKSLVDSINSTVSTHTTQIKATSDGLALKAEKSLVDTVKSTVDKHTTEIKVVADGLVLKAESSFVNTLKGTVDQHTLDITANSTAISARLTSAQVDALVTGKNYVNQTTLNATSSGLTAQITQVSTDLSSLEIEGRNYFNPATNPIVKSGGGTFTVNDNVPYGFYAVGDQAQTLQARLNNVITGNGLWTVSFDLKGSQNGGGAVRVDVCDGTVSQIQTPTNNEYSRFSITVNVTNYGDGTVYHFVDFKATWSYIWVKNIKVEKGGKATGFTLAPDDMVTLEKVVTIEANIDGINTLVASKASQTQVTQLAGQITTKVESATYNSKMTQLDNAINLRVTSTAVTEAILADKTIKDTRDDNQVPYWYLENYPRQEIREFKRRTTMGVPGSSTYVQVTTKVPWAGGTSGGVPVQVAESTDGTYQRVSSSSGGSWLAWEKIVDAGELISQINIQSGNILIQTGQLYLDTVSTHMTTAFVTDLKAKSLEAVYADIATLKTRVLTADVITSTMIKSDLALIDKLFATDANVQRLTAKTAFINSVKAVDISADKITGGVFNASTMNVIGLNANSMTSGTLNGANYSNNLSTGVERFTNPSTGDALTLSQGQILFTNGAQSRYLNYNAEGLQLVPGSGNTGTSKNTSLHLIGGGTGSYQYIQFASGSGITQRLEAEGQYMTAYHGSSGAFQVAKYGDNPNSGLVISGAYETRHSTGVSLRIAGDSISTPRDGARNIFLVPQGVGSVIAGNSSGVRYNMVASDFVKQSSRTTKKIIGPIREGLTAINRLTAITYYKLSKFNDGIIEIEKGFISEDSPDVATPDGKGIYDSHITAHLVKAVQELDQKVISIANIANASNTLASRTFSEMQQLKNKVTELELKIKKMESAA